MYIQSVKHFCHFTACQMHSVICCKYSSEGTCSNLVISGHHMQETRCHSLQIQPKALIRSMWLPIKSSDHYVCPLTRWQVKKWNWNIHGGTIKRWSAGNTFWQDYREEEGAIKFVIQFDVEELVWLNPLSRHIQCGHG